MTVTLHQLDAVELLKTLPDASIDLVITDPPYESLEKHRAKGTTTRLKHSKASSNDWFAIFPNARFPELFAQIYRVLKKNTHFYLFCDAETMFVAKPEAEAAGFKFWKPLVWDKRKIGMGYHYRARYEFILFFEKGKRKLQDLGMSDIIERSRIHRGYPTEKPALVSVPLVRQSSSVGETVLDPFMGSGSVGIAAIGSGRHFIGGDINPASIERCTERLIDTPKLHQTLTGSTYWLEFTPETAPVSHVCPLHERCDEHDFFHGGEALQLRERLESLVERGREVSIGQLQRVLDEVDARDSLAREEQVLGQGDDSDNDNDNPSPSETSP